MTKLPCLRVKLHCLMLEVPISSPLFLTPLRPQWPFTARLPSSPSQEKFWKRSERGMRCQPPLLGSPGVFGEFVEGSDLDLTHMSHKNEWKWIFLCYPNTVLSMEMDWFVPRKTEIDAAILGICPSKMSGFWNGQ